MSSNVINTGRSTNKRAMIRVIDLSDDDESTNAQPVMKSLKTDIEPVPSQEILDLRQKVAKLEKDFEGACVYARQFELDKEEKQKRVEFLENLLDTKPPKIDDTKEKKMAEELEKSRERVSALTKELEAERSQANEDRMRDRSRIDELTRKLKQYEGAHQQLLPEELKPRQAVQQPLAVAASQQQPLAMAVQRPSLQLSTLFSSGTTSTAGSDPNNFFELLPKGAHNSAALPYAKRKLRVGRSKNETMERGKAVFKGKKLHCSACGETFENVKILEHLFSNEHSHSVIVRWPNNAVSCIAINYWIEQLWSTLPGAAAITVAPPPVTVTLPITVAPRAPAANNGASTNEERAHLVVEIDE